MRNFCRKTGITRNLTTCRPSSAWQSGPEYESGFEMKNRQTTFTAIALAVAAVLYPAAANGQNIRTSDFKDTIHKVDSLYKEHSGSWGSLRLNKVVRKGETLNFHFTEGVSDFPVRPSDEKWLREQLQANLPTSYAKLKVGDIYSNSRKVSELATTPPGNDGTAQRSKYSLDEAPEAAPLVKRGISAPKGLEGRNIAMWQSHGWYFSQTLDRWSWQRACMFQTVEDLYTQSYVVPFLVPMLENAGAGVFLPRERDWNSSEIIIDNDRHETESGRIHGKVEIPKKWKMAGTGFADLAPYYKNDENPFGMGTSLKCECTSDRHKATNAVWSADIPQRGEYAVYVAYRSFPESCTAAEYTIHSLGGDIALTVNQRMGGSSWVYLGTFEFDSGDHALVTLSNHSRAGGTVVADAVKIGGGMGNIARGKQEKDFSVSGMPRFAEGARYFMQWSGIPDVVWSQNEGEEDYRDDFMSRGSWVKYLSGGSWVNPKEEGLGIPIDLSFAFHTDAGDRPDDGIIGTLAIYTLMCEGSAKLPSSGSRHCCREFTDFVQTQIVDEIREHWNPQWQRRMLWNRSYSESRTTGTPAILLELLSHQNFEDMKYGLDPAFRFSVARSCYKGILKFLSMHYGLPYTVQPLPVQAFSARISQSTPDAPKATLRWQERTDEQEPTAKATSFTIYTRIDGQGWNKGTKVTPKKHGGFFSYDAPILPGHIYSFKVVASNDGGNSFPSEILSVGVPQNASSADRIMIVNDFNRISAPTWFDTPMYAGFDNSKDSGVPYIRDWNFIGDQFEFRRSIKYENDDRTGFGASYEDYADKVVAGNTFDYPYVHGISILKAGYAFESCSALAFGCDPNLASGKDASALDGVFALDIICGKECVVRTGNNSPLRCGAFPEYMQNAIRNATDTGRHILISGSYIAGDCFDSVYPIDYSDSTLAAGRKALQKFIKGTLGYSLHRTHASRTGEVKVLGGGRQRMSFPVKPNSESYCVECPDALHAFHMGSEIYMSYADSGLPAAVRTSFGNYKVAAFGFPIEIIASQEGRDDIIRSTLAYFRK